MSRDIVLKIQTKQARLRPHPQPSPTPSPHHLPSRLPTDKPTKLQCNQYRFFFVIPNHTHTTCFVISYFRCLQMSWFSIHSKSRFFLSRNNSSFVLCQLFISSLSNLLPSFIHYTDCCYKKLSNFSYVCLSKHYLSRNKRYSHKNQR